jgi:hypothetical protein
MTAERLAETKGGADDCTQTQMIPPIWRTITQLQPHRLQCHIHRWLVEACWRLNAAGRTKVLAQ